MKIDLNKKHKIYFVLGFGFLLFGFISYFPLLTLIQERDQNLLFVNSQMLPLPVKNYNILLDVDQNQIPGQISEESSIVIEKTDEIILPQDESLTVLNSTSQITNQIDSNGITSVNYDIPHAGQFQITLPEEIYSSLALKWNDGKIFAGNSDDDLSQIIPTDDLFISSFNYLSELIYDLNPTLIIESTSATKLSIDLFTTLNSGNTLENNFATITEIVNKDSGAKFSNLPIISRDTWGASTNLWDPYSSTNIDSPLRFSWYPGYYRVSKFVIHHTASPNTADDPSRAVRDIYLYHAYSRGWGDVGYNYLIDQWGNIYEGKAGGDEVYGYHAYTQANTMSVGISLIGNFTSSGPTAAQKESLKKLLAEKSTFYNIPLNFTSGSLASWLSENITVFGHNDSYFWCYNGHPLDYLCSTGDKWVINNTACPGLYLDIALQNEIVPAARSYASVYSVNANIKSAVITTNDILKNVNQTQTQFIVQYDLPHDVDPSVIRAKIPQFSGIVSSVVIGNTVTITVGDWDDGVLVPYYGWTGFTSGTFFPASQGPIDRMRTLIKIFLLDPDVRNVGLNNVYNISPIE